jgi:hypothetical protein
MNNLLKSTCKFYNLNNNKKRTTTALLYLFKLNNNRRKQNMAQIREQLTLCSTQVNKHTIKHLVCPRINIKNVNSWGNKRNLVFSR